LHGDEAARRSAVEGILRRFKNDWDALEWELRKSIEELKQALATMLPTWT